MSEFYTTIEKSLETVGLGPQRLERAMSGASLFGRTGLLNSIEFVQFIAALSEETGVDAFEFMEEFNVAEAGIFGSVQSLLTYLGGRSSQAMAG